MANGKLTTQERLMKLEVKLEDVCSDIGEIKDTLNRFIDSSDKKYALRTELASMKKIVYTISGAVIGFLVWTLQEYLKHISIK